MTPSAPGARPLPLKFQVGARTLASIRRDLVRVPLGLDEALAGQLPDLPPIDASADGYLFTSLPVHQRAALVWTGDGMIAYVRQRYTRRYADLTVGFETYLDQLSGNTRSAIKRKAKKVAAVSGGKLDVRRF